MWLPIIQIFQSLPQTSRPNVKVTKQNLIWKVLCTCVKFEVDTTSVFLKLRQMLTWWQIRIDIITPTTRVALYKPANKSWNLLNIKSQKAIIKTNEIMFTYRLFYMFCKILLSARIFWSSWIRFLTLKWSVINFSHKFKTVVSLILNIVIAMSYSWMFVFYLNDLLWTTCMYTFVLKLWEFHTRLCKCSVSSVYQCPILQSTFLPTR
mgnify:CR=1 FL=1